MSCVQGCVGTGHATSGIAPNIYILPDLLRQKFCGVGQGISTHEGTCEI